MKYPKHLTQLIEFLKKFPGVGQKSAERYAFNLLDWPQEQLEALGELFKATPRKIQYCSNCHTLSQEDRCLYCSDPKRNQDQLCIVAFPKDVFSIEESHFYNGLYFVLGKLLSPLSGYDQSDIELKSLKTFISKLQLSEIILAFDSTVEGDATTLFLKKELASTQIPVSRLAFGIPVGSSLDYIDSSTLSRAFAGRGGF